MTWGAVAGAAIGVVGSSLMSSGGTGQTNGGAGSTTVDKSPWLQAQPWITNNMTTGQALQNKYAQTPFNAQQLGAYQNLGNQTNYVNQLVPSLLGQISGQQVGFNRANPQARPQAYNFNGTGVAPGTNPGGGVAGGGLLSQLASPAPSATSAANPPPPPAPTPVAAPATPTLYFQPGGQAESMFAQGLGLPTTGGYGAFKYGDTPAPGTQAYKDMSAYFAAGGNDPQNLYGHGTPNMNTGAGGA